MVCPQKSPRRTRPTGGFLILTAWILFFMIWIMALIACFSHRFVFSLLCLWATGLGVGGIFLWMGMEFLAFTQWFITSVNTLLFLLFSVTLPEAPSSQTSSLPSLQWFFLSLSLGLFFLFLFLSRFLNRSIEFLPHISEAFPIARLGRFLMEHHFWSAQIFLFSLLLILIGTGASLSLLQKRKQIR